MGYSTIKTIEETLRSKAGVMGATRKEIPTRLDRLQTMGIFKRGTRPRGAGEVETGELVADHPAVTALTSGLDKPAAREPRPPRAPRRERGTRLVGSAEGQDAGGEARAEAPVEALGTPAEAAEVPAPAVAEEQVEVASPAKPVQATPPTRVSPARAAVKAPPPAEESAEPFRWVSGGAAGAPTAATEPAPAAEAASEPDNHDDGGKAPAKPRRAAAKKPAAPRRKAATPRASTKKKTEPDTPAAAEPAADQGPGEPPPG